MSRTNHAEGQLGVENCTFNLHVQCASSVTHPYFMLYCNVQHDGSAVLSSVTALLVVPGILLPGPKELAHAPGQAGRGDRRRRRGGSVIAECLKESSMAQAKHPRKRQGNAVRPCAWCANPVHGEAVTVTFPDKEQATFHVACLYKYRDVMWPRAAR